MDAFDQANELVAHAETQLESIRQQYNACIQLKSISSQFLIEIKNFMENLRSALDYCAHGLFAKFGNSSCKHQRIYFPYAPLDKDRAYFRRRVEECLPGLSTARPDILRMLESYQYFGSRGNILSIFMELNNENKHQQLTPQVERNLWGIQLQVTVPPGGTFELPTDPVRLQEFVQQHGIPVMTWKGFEFTTNGVLVGPLLIHSLRLIKQIVNELSAPSDLPIEGTQKVIAAALEDLATKDFDPIGYCIYCWSQENLTDEHVIPFALGGKTKLPKASCVRCATITGKFEQEVFRGPMQQVRVFREIQSRTKHKSAPKTKRITVTREDGIQEEIEVGFADAPVIYSFPLLSPPAHIEPAGFIRGVRLRGHATYGFGPTSEEVLKAYKATKITVGADYLYEAFARTIAKMAYVMAIAQGGRNIFEGDPYILPALLGQKDEIGRWVGMLDPKFERHDGQLHRVTFGKINDPHELVAGVQLFADSGTPQYVVILGRTSVNL